MSPASEVTTARRRFQARALAAMFGAGAVLGVVSAVIPHGAAVNASAWAINASLGVPTAALLAFFAGRTPEWVLHALLVVGAGMVSLGVIFGAGGPASVATSFFYVWVALYVFWFFSPRVAIAHLVLDSLMFAGVLWIEGSPAGPAVWLLVTGTATVVGAVVALMNRELVRAANIDALTGLPTRVVFNDAVAREIARAERNATALCLAIIDVDDLKAVNDRYGHQTGDRVLAETAQAWRAALRETDLLVRFGGDEFVAVLPGCTAEIADGMLERVRSSSPISCSVGMAWWCSGDDAVDLLARADAQLYDAKHVNRMAGQEPHPATEPLAS